MQAAQAQASESHDQGTQDPEDPSWFWADVEKPDLHSLKFLTDMDVRVFYQLGMVLVCGKLLKIDFDNVRRICDSQDEFEERICRSYTYAFRKMTTAAFRTAWDATALERRLGTYVLFFGSNYRNRHPVFSNHAVLHRRMPGMRTCDEWLVYVQRRAARAWRARKSLAFAMALHGRLGQGSGAACLDEELAALVCGFL